MNKVIIFGGTSEGRLLAETLAKQDIICVYCVATEYGKEPIEESGCIHINSGRMDAEGMVALYECERPDAIIDATHPFAELVKGEIEKSLSSVEGIPFYRLSREEDNIDVTNCVFFDNTLDCAMALANTEGNIFLTTGSKELSVFCQEEAIKERLIARIIPNDESLDVCKNCGLKGNQIVAMQGPFSQRMNMAFLKEYDAKIMVLKESGKAGGEAAKIEAANACGVKCFVIKRPQEKVSGLSFDAVVDKLFDLFNITNRTINEKPEVVIQDIKLEIVLAGYGMGQPTLTLEVKNAIEEADFLFGAPRMLVGVDTKAKKYPYYLAKDIVPVILDLKHQITFGIKKAVILFSGDIGFYSGATKLEKELNKLEFCRVRTMPGISTLSALAAKAKETYQDAALISTHGIAEDTWKPKLVEAVKHNEKTFVLTSGSKDVRLIGELLGELEKQGTNKYRIFVGNNLYSGEKTQWMPAERCSNYDEEGLCSLIIRNEYFKNKFLAPGLADTEFIRDKVPMSKEEIRALSICKLRPEKNAVIYDIGSGSGSVAVELGLLDASVNVYAIELKPEACSLIKKNVEKFDLYNVKVIEGTAPDALANLPAPTHVFIGGSAGRLQDILTHLKSLNCRIKVVINAVTIETIAEINQVLKANDISEADVSQVSISRTKQAGDYSILQGQNPVFIASFTI